MKRKTNKPVEYSGRTFTLFAWNKCCLCSEEFRREHGHWALIYHRWYYLCRECGGDSELTGMQGFMKWERLRKENRPPPPKPIPAGIRVIKEGERYPKG